MAIPSSFGAELAAGADLDYVVVDQQHGIEGYDSMVPVLQAIEAAGATPITRVLSGDPFLGPTRTSQPSAPATRRSSPGKCCASSW